MRRKLYYIFLAALLPLAGVNAQEIVLDSVGITPVTCYDSEDGTITVYISGGIGDLKYDLRDASLDFLETSGDTASRTFTFSGYGKDNYWVFIYDSGGSSPKNTYVGIGSPDPITIQSVNTSDQTCSYLSNGTITVTATGEGDSLFYQLTGTVTDNNTDGVFSGLPVGTYNVEVTDIDGCPSSDNASGITINSPPPVTITLDSNVPATCFGGADGSISITPGGGTPSGSGTGYTYSWTGPDGFTSTNEDITNLRAGEYTVTVIDNNGCEESMGPITVGQASEITVAPPTITDVNCSGESNGAISITPAGGTPPYTYVWTGQVTGPVSTDQNPSALSADTYSLKITDAAGCPKTFDNIAVVTEPDPIMATVTSNNPVRCFGESNGSAEINVTGGTPGYSYAWTPASGSNPAEKDPADMPAGTYSLKITDANGCDTTFTDILVITEPDDITAVLDGFTNVSCFGGANGTAQVTVSNGTPGYTYLWTGTGTGHTSTAEDPDNLIKDTYDLKVTDANDCEKNFLGIVTIDQPDEITIGSPSITHIVCFGDSTGAINISPAGGTPSGSGTGYTYNWTGPYGFTSPNKDISNLKAGDYTVIVKDNNDCSETFGPITVTQASEIIVTDTTITPVTCNGGINGAISITAAGGTGSYDFIWTGLVSGPVSTDQNPSALSADTYSLTITDAAGCPETFDNIAVVTEPDPLTASFIPIDVQCYGYDDGKINVTVTGGTPGYNYDWSRAGMSFSTDEDISGLAPGDYSLKVTDANSCSETYTDVVTIEEPTEISISATTNNITCNGADDGSIAINTSGGTPGYSYDWTSPNGFTSVARDISSLEPGIYNLTVRDNNNCTQIFSDTLTEPDPISVTFDSQTDLACNGESDGAIEINITGGQPPYAFSWTNSQGEIVSTDKNPTDLPAGTYSLQVTDNGPCIATYPDAVEITEPSELTTSLSKTDVECSYLSNGTITVTSSGGTSPYEHSRFPNGPYTADSVFIDLSNGTYRIYTRDANSCQTSGTITINKPKAIDYGYSRDGKNFCNGDSNVTISINNVTGGVAPYEYSIDGGTTYQSSSEFHNLPAGSYPVVVRDENLCEQAITPLTILEPDPIIITYYDQQDVQSCYDAEEGEILIMGEGGNGNIKFSLNGAPPVDLGEFSNLLGGDYTISLIDEQLCQKDTIVEILRPDELIFERADVVNVTGCPGDSNGEIDASVIGGTGVKEYSIDSGSTWQPAGSYASLTAGDYTIMVRDANGCEVDTTVTVSEPLPISITSETATPASCFGTSTGSVAIEVAGATPPYTYSLTPPLLPDQSTETSKTFSGLPAGEYTISVTDAEGCGTLTSNTLTITEPPELIVDSVKTEHITCNGSNDGKIDIYLVGGTLPYEYSIDNEATWEAASSFTGLGPGTYEVYVRDVNDCSEYAGSFIITEPPVLDVAAFATDVAPCFGGTNGAISANASGGWNSYEYSIDGINYQVSGDFADLPSGDYTIYVRDGGNCIVTTDKIITEPEQVTAVINKTDYVDDVLGTITISDATGGTPPYEYSIDGASGTFTSNTSYTDLTAGTYEVVVKDANGCTFEESIEIFDIIPLEMLITSTDVTCFGDDNGTIEFDPQDGVGTVHYSIDDGTTYTTEPLFENLKGDSTYLLQAYDEEAKQYSGSVYIAEPEELYVSTNVTPANCNAFSETGSADITATGGTGDKAFSWSNGSTDEDLSNVESGEYTVIITDEAGCSLEQSLFIPALVTVNVDAGEDTTVCAGATITLEGTRAADHNMLWEPQTFLNEVNIPDPVAANITESVTYTYTLQETSSGFGCYDIDTLSIEALPVYGLEITPDTSGLTGETVQLEVLNSGEYVSYEWTPETGLSMSTVADPLVTLQNTIRYWLQATNDYGCVETDSILIRVVEDIKIYNAFSPNGDQINDYFDIENAYEFENIIVEVYNRWGSRIFYSEGYSDEQRWDGTFNGKDVPTGTYYYVVIPRPEAEPITGNVTIIR